LPRTLTATDRAGRHVRADAADLVRKIVQRHVQFFETLSADQHRNLLVGEPFVLDALDAAREQILLHAAHHRDQLVDIARTGYENCQYRFEIDEAAHRRRLDARGKVAQVFDALLHLIERGDEIRVVVEFRDDARVLVRGVRRDLAQVVQRAQLLFDRRRDEFGDVLGRCAAPLHFHVYDRDMHRRVDLRRNPMDRPEPGKNHHDHREICGDAMFGEPPDHWISPTQDRRGAGLHDSCQPAEPR
jgi:hypothetical protein